MKKEKNETLWRIILWDEKRSSGVDYRGLGRAAIKSRQLEEARCEDVQSVITSNLVCLGSGRQSLEQGAVLMLA